MPEWLEIEAGWRRDVGQGVQCAALIVDVNASTREQGGEWDHAMFLGATWLAGKLF